MGTAIWEEAAPATGYPALQQEVHTDVAIVGGGITGITAAYLLARSGKKVLVLEAGELAGGTSGHSTGNLYSMVDKRLHHIQTKWDKKTAGIVARSRGAAVDLVEELIEKHGIECDFRRVPWYLFSETDAKDTTIEKERKAAADYGLDVEEVTELPLPLSVKRAIRVQHQAQFNPAAFVKGLATHIPKEKCEIYENTPVQSIENKDQVILSTPGGKVWAKKVILATHTPKGIFALHTALYPHREYALAFKLTSADYPPGIFWDTSSKDHHSIRTYETEKGKFLLVLGGHHKVGQEDHYGKYFEQIEQSARKHFDVGEVAFKWSAQHYKPADGLPYIGESTEKNIFLATGFSTDGLTYGVVSAMILDDLLNTRENKWSDTYKAGRFTPAKSAKEFLKENLNVMKQYLKNLPGKSEVEKFGEVPVGEGRVIEKEGEKLAVFRDDSGKLLCHSAVCTHLGCIVDWNDAERSWDCPCHGSRFTPTGEVIEGPALSPLKPKDVPKN